MRPQPSPVHPHGRGERQIVTAAYCPAVGSSPRAWGTVVLELVVSEPVRFIPTGVGNGKTKNGDKRQVPVHPHGRGERRVVAGISAIIGGSSPRAWGTVRAIRRRSGINRFIPTGVGNGRWSARRRPRRTVHPHGRGERGARIGRRVCGKGSSPRAWGTARWGRAWRAAARFIPTGVGNGGIMRHPRNNSPVHPHGRGER